jgi:DUF1680 family protein
MTVNGAKANPTAADGWLTLNGTWQDDTLVAGFAMEPRVVAVKRRATFKKNLCVAVECGPLLFALKYKEKWTPTTGTPLTPLPVGMVVVQCHV